VDFSLYARVLWRFKLLVLLGLMLAIALATLSLVKVSADGLTYRQAELWSSTTRIGVTQTGNPWVRLFAQEPFAEGQKAVDLGIPVADPNRLNNLAVLYAELAMSDPVRRLMRQEGPVRGDIIATPLVRGDNRIMLPLIDLTAISTSPRAAIDISTRSAAALEKYIRQQQGANEVPPADRVVILEVQRPKGAKIFQPRSKTMPIVVFLAVMLAITGLAFLLENLRPRVREPGEANQAFRESQRRRSA
jgi:hypothetical protein